MDVTDKKPPGEGGEGGSPAENGSGEESWGEKAPLKALRERGNKEKASVSQVSGARFQELCDVKLLILLHLNDHQVCTILLPSVHRQVESREELREDGSDMIVCGV